MARAQRQRWSGWRTQQPDAPIKGDQPTKKPGTKKRKRKPSAPWYWVRNRKPGACNGCRRDLDVGEVVAFRSNPKGVLCKACVTEKGIEPKTSRKLAEERREAVERQLRKKAASS